MDFKIISTFIKFLRLKEKISRFFRLLLHFNYISNQNAFNISACNNHNSIYLRIYSNKSSEQIIYFSWLFNVIKLLTLKNYWFNIERKKKEKNPIDKVLQINCEKYEI